MNALSLMRQLLAGYSEASPQGEVFAYVSRAERRLAAPSMTDVKATIRECYRPEARRGMTRQNARHAQEVVRALLAAEDRLGPRQDVYEELCRLGTCAAWIYETAPDGVADETLDAHEPPAPSPQGVANAWFQGRTG